MPHINRIDSRINIVKKLIEPFQLQLNGIVESVKIQGGEYWDMLYADDTEHFVGTVFIILQNYINSSISDLYPELEKIHLKYSIGTKIENTNSTKIQLIISMANYYKHRDLPSALHKYTSNTLNDLDIEYKCFYDVQNDKYFHEIGSNSPVFTGFTKLSENWDFNDVLDAVAIWRENMWQIEENNTQSLGYGQL
ncbi:hypothetical protein ACHRV1_17600 [Flavobacterium aquidurense]|uniref:hypothetical protein n=1 Tax=Flavobacterium aquidurense TaxID=362413 RepID=UPI0037583E04